MKDILSRFKKDEEELFHESMTNAYILITNQLSFNELVEHNGCYLPYHPKKPVNDDVFDDLIDYFCELEDFEKCADLKKVKESKNYNKNFINL